MSKFQNFKFGVDNIALIDADFNVYGIDDPQNASLNLTYEIAEHRGGANNDLRKVAIHSRNGELTMVTGYADVKLAQLLTGGTITSLGTSSASITTGSATGINTLVGATGSIVSAILSITINSPSVVVTSDYYVSTDTGSQVIVTRVFDGYEFDAVTLTNSTTVAIADGLFSLHVGTDGSSLVDGEKAFFEARSEINSINQRIDFDNNKPAVLTAQITVDFDGYRHTIEIPNVQPAGSIQGSSATEFQIQDLTMKIYNSEVLNRIAAMAIQG